MKPAATCRPCRFLVVLLVLAGTLAACGQYGDLYLPPEQTQQQKKEQPASTDNRQDEDPSQAEE